MSESMRRKTLRDIWTRITFSGAIKTDTQKKREPHASKLKTTIFFSGVIKTDRRQTDRQNKVFKIGRIN
jgi:predicted double-glycine peptidase